MPGFRNNLRPMSRFPAAGVTRLGAILSTGSDILISRGEARLPDPSRARAKSPRPPACQGRVKLSGSPADPEA